MISTAAAMPFPGLQNAKEYKENRGIQSKIAPTSATEPRRTRDGVGSRASLRSLYFRYACWMRVASTLWKRSRIRFTIYNRKNRKK
jgi:hypothetical protein